MHRRFIFSRSYCRRYDRLLAWYYRLPIYLQRSALWGGG